MCTLFKCRGGDLSIWPSMFVSFISTLASRVTVLRYRLLGQYIKRLLPEQHFFPSQRWTPRKSEDVIDKFTSRSSTFFLELRHRSQHRGKNVLWICRTIMLNPRCETNKFSLAPFFSVFFRFCRCGHNAKGNGSPWCPISRKNRYRGKVFFFFSVG